MEKQPKKQAMLLFATTKGKKFEVHDIIREKPEVTFSMALQGAFDILAIIETDRSIDEVADSLRVAGVSMIMSMTEDVRKEV